MAITGSFPGENIVKPGKPSIMLVKSEDRAKEILSFSFLAYMLYRVDQNNGRQTNCPIPNLTISYHAY